MEITIAKLVVVVVVVCLVRIGYPLLDGCGGNSSRGTPFPAIELMKVVV